MDWVIDENKAKKTNDLINMLNSNNEYQSNGYMYKRGVSNKNLSSSNKVKRISTKFMRDKDNETKAYSHIQMFKK